jgi:hypothetical protein
MTSRKRVEIVLKAATTLPHTAGNFPHAGYTDGKSGFFRYCKSAGLCHKKKK